VPVTLGAIAGRALGDRFAPRRLLPLHTAHLELGALMHDYGTWQRPVAYLRATATARESRANATARETRAEATAREINATRTSAVLFDSSSLGKIEIEGPDTIDFLDRFYINDLTTLKHGRVRYGIMLHENGAIFDDGTVTLLAPDHALITTTSGNAARVAAWLEESHQCEWPTLRVAITPVTEAWATLALAGPRAREILKTLDSDINLAPDAFPHLGFRTGHLRGIPTRIARVSFTGELSYEISIPTTTAPDLWQALMTSGGNNIQPLGMDALLALRLEKGFLHIGTDTDGTTVPDDVGWGHVATAKRRDYIGKRSLRLPENVRSERLQLVGLTRAPANNNAYIGTDLIVGSHVSLEESTEATDGWITSAGRSSDTGTAIALALVRGGRSRINTRVTVHDAGQVTHATIVAPPFFDPKGERMNA
jgi:sarcosine oxidase subunit alpha